MNELLVDTALKEKLKGVIPLKTNKPPLYTKDMCSLHGIQEKEK